MIVEFKQLKAEVKIAELDSIRTETEDYFETVIKNSCLKSLTQILEKSFGPPVWPSRNKLSIEAEKIVKNFGSLRKGQTLYFSTHEGSTVFAMLWPWQDNEKVTIKMGKA